MFDPKKIFLAINLLCGLLNHGTESPDYTISLATTYSQENDAINQKISRGLTKFDTAATKGGIHFPSMIVVTSSDNAIVGGANYEMNISEHLGNDCYVKDIWVDEQYRGNGIGTKIMSEMVRHAFMNQCHNINARVYSYQDKAKRFFEKNGFTTTATIPSPISGNSFETYCMEKQLTQDIVLQQLRDAQGKDCEFTGFSLRDKEGNVINFDKPLDQEIQDKIAQGYRIVGYGLHHKKGFDLNLDEGYTCPKISDTLFDYNAKKSNIEVESPYTVYATSQAGEIAGGAHGNIAVRNNEHFCIINELWVDQNHRNMKLGTKIVAEVVKHAQSKNCQSIRLETRAWQAKSFYDKLGFVVTATKPSTYFNGAKDYFMMKKLSA